MRHLILGDGILGKEIHLQTGWEFLSRKKDGIDAKNFEGWSHLLSGFDVIINCIAHTKTYSDDKDLHWEINFQFVDRLVDYCNLNQIKLIHISTDYIYSNSVSMAKETDVPCHIPTWYCYTKLLGDSLVQLRSREYLICRLSFKPYPFPYTEAWEDLTANCDFVDVMSSMIVKLIEGKASGVYNIGTGVKTIYEMCIERGQEVKPVKSPGFAPKDITMNTEKLINFFKSI
jgi:nucleoside-diphosphate-sugar epimerase